MPWFRNRQRPSRRWDVPDTGGREAREKAERELVQMRRQTIEVQAETPQYQKLSEDLREIHAVRNGLAEAFLTAARRRQA